MRDGNKKKEGSILTQQLTINRQCNSIVEYIRTNSHFLIDFHAETISEVEEKQRSIVVVSEPDPLETNFVYEFYEKKIDKETINITNDVLKKGFKHYQNYSLQIIDKRFGIIWEEISFTASTFFIR
jgi:predicted Zn-dependent protease